MKYPGKIVEETAGAFLDRPLKFYVYGTAASVRGKREDVLAFCHALKAAQAAHGYTYYPQYHNAAWTWVIMAIKPKSLSGQDSPEE